MPVRSRRGNASGGESRFAVDHVCGAEGCGGGGIDEGDGAGCGRGGGRSGNGEGEHRVGAGGDVRRAGDVGDGGGGLGDCKGRRGRGGVQAGVTGVAGGDGIGTGREGRVVGSEIEVGEAWTGGKVGRTKSVKIVGQDREG